MGERRRRRSLGEVPLEDRPGIRFLTNEDAAEVVGASPEHHNRDFRDAIDRGEYPSWTLQVQIMPVAEAESYRFNPFDLTKVWPHADYPPIEIGRMTLTRNPDNYFAHVEQAAFDPGHLVPGIGPSPDKMLQARLIAYGDAHRYRLGVNHTQLPVNCPHETKAQNYGRDGFMRFDENNGRAKNYEPNSFNGPVQTSEPLYAPLEVHGLTGAHPCVLHPEDNDFVQAGNLFRLMDEDERERLVQNIAGSLSQVSKEDIVVRSVANFAAADPEYGSRVAEAVAAQRRQSVSADEPVATI